MFIQFGSTLNPLVGLTGRLSENLYRTALMIVVGLIVLFVLWRTVNILFHAVAVLGSAWLTWQVFNLAWSFGSGFGGSPPPGASTPLFKGEQPLSAVGFFFLGTSKQFLVSAIAVAIAVVVYLTGKKTKGNEDIPKTIRIAAAMGVWAGVLMIYGFLAMWYPNLA